MKKFRGIFPVMVTAYDESGSIDAGAMEEMTSYLIESGVHGLTILGSGGECPYVSRDLQKAVIDVVTEKCAGSVPVIVGVNERGTDAAIEMAAYAQRAGADGLLVALPLFYPLSEEDVYRHYEKICERVDMPVLYYNFPTHTHLALTSRQIAKISRIANIVGAKETIFKSADVKELVDATDNDFCVFTGTCLNLTKMMGVGACGAICPLPNVAPKTAVELYEALNRRSRKGSRSSGRDKKAPVSPWRGAVAACLDERGAETPGAFRSRRRQASSSTADDRSGCDGQKDPRRCRTALETSGATPLILELILLFLGSFINTA